MAGAAAYRMANVLLSAGHLGSARILAIRAADRLRPVMTATFSHTSMWGALLATAAQAAARDHAAAEAWELLGASKVAADQVPCAIGHAAYGLSALRSGLERFTFLLDASDGEDFFGPGQ